MRPGGGKAKGAGFERQTCKALSLWVSGGKREDLFWRSAMSGGRATVAARRGAKVSAQAGDITATHEDGHVLTNTWLIECKRINDLNYASFFLKGQGRLAGFWTEACVQALRHGKMPMLIAREDMGETTILIARANQALAANQVADLFLLPAVTRIATGYKFNVQLHDFDALMQTPFRQISLPRGARWLQPGEDPFAITFRTVERAAPQRQKRKPRRQARGR